MDADADAPRRRDVDRLVERVDEDDRHGVHRCEENVTDAEEDVKVRAAEPEDVLRRLSCSELEKHDDPE